MDKKGYTYILFIERNGTLEREKKLKRFHRVARFTRSRVTVKKWSS